MCKFHLGQKVVCINDNPDGYSSGSRIADETPFLLVKGEIYTVSGNHYNRATDSFGIFLEEIPLREPLVKEVNGNWYRFKDGGYHEDRFRPLKETKIDIFLSMLNPSDETIQEFLEEEEHV